MLMLFFFFLIIHINIKGRMNFNKVNQILNSVILPQIMSHFFCNTFVSHFSVTLLCHTFVSHFCVTLLCHTFLPHFSVTHFSHTFQSHFSGMHFVKFFFVYLCFSLSLSKISMDVFVLVNQYVMLILIISIPLPW